MNDTARAFEAPDPVNLPGIERSRRVLAPKPKRIHPESSAEQEGRGREIALEAMKEDKRIWMRRSDGALAQVFVNNIDDDAAKCCWVQPDGSVMTKERSFAQIAQDQIAALEERAVARSESVDAHALVKNLYNAREEKRKKGPDRDRIEPLHVFDSEAGHFFQVSDDIRLGGGGSGDFTPKDINEGEDPFEKVTVSISDPEGRGDRTIKVTPTQFMRDQLAYFRNVTRKHPLGEQEGIEEHVRKTRRLEAQNEDAQRQQRWDFADILRRESGYRQTAVINGIELGVGYFPRERRYELHMDHEDKGRRDKGYFHEYIIINEDWGLSKKGAESVFLFAKAQLEAGEDLANVLKKVGAFVRSLQKES